MSKIKLKLDISKLTEEIEIEVDELEENLLNKDFAGTPFHFTEYGWSVVNETILSKIDIKSGEFIKE